MYKKWVIQPNIKETKMWYKKEQKVIKKMIKKD